jgi:hypothetical protein
MPSAFATIARQALQPAYALVAEPFVWTPMKSAADVNAPPVPDTGRPGGIVAGGFFDKPSRRQRPNVFDPRADQRPGEEANVPRVEFAPPVDGAPPDVRRLDTLEDELGRVWRVETTYVKKTGVLVATVNSLA